jgi:hypothetical protein
LKNLINSSNVQWAVNMYNYAYKPPPICQLRLCWLREIFTVSLLKSSLLQISEICLIELRQLSASALYASLKFRMRSFMRSELSPLLIPSTSISAYSVTVAPWYLQSLGKVVGLFLASLAVYWAMNSRWFLLRMRRSVLRFNLLAVFGVSTVSRHRFPLDKRNNP